MTTSETILEKLERLAAQRTVRTDRLHDAVRALLAALDKVTEIGDRAAHRGLRLCRERLRSNVGSESYWAMYRDEEFACYLDAPLNERGYLHGDFSTPVRGPSRADLLAFGRWASALVDLLVERLAGQVGELDTAIDAINSASKGVRS